MRFAGRSATRSILLGALTALAAIGVWVAHAAEKPRIRAEDYRIEATVWPQAHKLAARAAVKFVALDDVTIASFELHNALRITKITDQRGNVLSPERVPQDSSVRVPLSSPMGKGQEATLTFEYEGILTSEDDSPVPGLKLAYVGEASSYLLYSRRWFPVTNYGIDRFTAQLQINAPAEYTVVSSGSATAPVQAAPANATEAKSAATESRNRGVTVEGANTASSEASAPPEGPRLRRHSRSAATKAKAGTSTAKKKRAKAAAINAAQPSAPEGAEPKFAASVETKPAPRMPEPKLEPGMASHRFFSNQPGFPGTVVIGKFVDTPVSEAGITVHVFFAADKSSLAQSYGETAAKQLAFFTTLYGVPTTPELRLVELPDDSVPTTWAPELAGIAARNINPKLNYRLLANAVAHQWFGGVISPATRNDWWIQDGGARYSEARYIAYASGTAGEQDAVKDMAVGALAYESVPLGQIGTLNTFDPVFQSMANDKGAMVYHMLRWVMGDQKFDQTMRALFANYAGKAVSVKDLQKLSSEVYGEPLTWFYSQWLDSTGAPEFKNKYTIFRVKNGFRVVGQIKQDLDLFRMPLEVKIDTDGKSELKKIDVVGTDSSYTIETFGKPRKITLDPGNWVLKNSPELRMRSAILRGQQLVQQGNLADSLKEFHKAIEQNRNSSLAHYRIAEVYYLQKNYQAAANEYRDALNGDGEPKWTEVWCHIQLGKIFDITGQRERALGEYRQALQTNDNTQGAMEEARLHMQSPFERPETE